MAADKSHLRKNSEKASVAAIVAQNNDTLSKLIAGEVTKLGFNGKNAKITAFENAQKEAATNASELMAEMKAEEGDFNIKRDILASQAIEKQQNISADNLRQTLSGTGEEFNFTKVGQHQTKPVVEEEPGIQFHSNATYTDATGTHRDAIGREITTDMNVNKITDDVAFAAQKAISEDVALERTVITEKAEYIDPHKYNRDGKGQIITNTPAHNQLHSEKTAAVVDYSISGHNQKAYAETLKLEKDTKELAIEAKKLADATELQAEKDASNTRAQENLDWAAENLKQQKIKESALQRKDDVADRIEKIEKIKERDKKWAEINDNNDKILATQKFADDRAGIEDPVRPAYEPGVGSNQSQYEIANQRIVEATKEAEQDAINNTSIKDMTTTVREIEAERAKKEANLKSNAGTTPLGADVAERVRQEKRIAEEKAVQGSLDDEQSTNAKKIEERRIAEAERVQRSIDDEQKIMGAQNQLISEGPSTRSSKGKFRKLQAEKQLAKEMEVAKRVGDHMDRNQAPKVGKNMWPLQNDPYSFSTLSYPPEATNSKENGHFMLFYVNVQDKTKYQYDGVRNGGRVKVGDYIERPGYFESGDVTNVPPALRGANKFISSVEASGLGANAGTIDYQRQIVKNGGPGNILYNNMAFLSKGRKPKSGINSRYPTTTRITDSVALYLPSGIGNTTSASYGDFQTGVAGYLAMSGLDIVSELRNRDFQGAAEKLFGVGGTLITEAAKKLAVAGIETFTGSEGIQQSIDKAFGQTLNPYIEVAFNSTGMRTFDYTFKFAPKSKEETDEVQAIIQLFRFHMLPEMKSAAHRYLTLPSTFDIHYMWQSGIDERGYSSPMARENSFYNKIATCVLTNIDVDYTPNGEVQSFSDGAPTQIAMSLSFKETEMLTKQHVQEGF